MSFTESENWIALLESVSRISKSSGAELDQESDEKPFTRAEISYLNKLLNSKLFETHDLDFEILRSDPNHPLHSVRTFQELNLKEPLLKGIAAMGFYKPSTIQEQALSSLISDNPQNMIAQSQSGTGKTATFLLAMLSRINTDVHYCQCLCMAPTRELALQIESVGRQMAQFMPEVSFATAVRSPRVKVDSNGYVTDQIVIGTPGTIANWFRGTGEHRIDPSKVVMFVLDEADIMIEEEGFLNICMRVKKQVSGFIVFYFLYNSNRPFF
ncbi:DEAD box ATP-dependent RNA helicase, putative [Schistosoma mansoni]|uniref:DEAD box ATP-dependent RNA helicase, putative n=1 Tax=Schistosoma mansoni TaxID=6183 RepID=UPI0001A62404|nr:DEAD box ATP-dependent RNA helicase, putative [Schistosoma mansoni]|eukprot:XP_018646689.1 DEAD box ATP-dependent RNA helicase, putative [Schistosoma mansoni]